jgi:hypothetical protein
LFSVKSNFDKRFAIFIPTKFRDTRLDDEKISVKTSKQLLFYWINNNKELVTCSSREI